jgi:hypothetical protein
MRTQNVRRQSSRAVILDAAREIGLPQQTINLAARQLASSPNEVRKILANLGDPAEKSQLSRVLPVLEALAQDLPAATDRAERGTDIRANRPKLTLRFEIKSLDERKTVDAVPEIANLAPELAVAIASQYPGTTAEILRVEGLPVVPEIQELLLRIDWHAVASGTEQAISAFATTQFLKLMKQNFRNVFTKPLASGSPGLKETRTPTAVSPETKRTPSQTPAKPESSKKSTKQAKMPKGAKRKGGASQKRRK